MGVFKPFDEIASFPRLRNCEPTNIDMYVTFQFDSVFA